MPEELNRIALAWLEKARHDLETARRVVEGTAEPITDTAVYHCQQAAEKALKAVLVEAGQPVFKTHDLMMLLTKCAAGDQRFTRWIDLAATLTPYATHFRYPCSDPDPGLEEALEAIALATDLYEFVRTRFDAHHDQST
ncbi:hypothetical protein CCR95_07955 [Thiocystis minor]|uniref:HEPN domain-containing protein n=1 Tax=Thiocystis minor TaxID=61597 RepID=UPI0019145B5B|nr:HEPN domain-containing protein [Thiocystis minor]MBK5964022.1 hypothetical protein [Thiocystis minor]